jgi:glutamate 5-kinase
MTVVVKLGSSIVAADDGSLRTEVLDSVCEQVAALEGAGERVVMVTSGAIARGMRLLELTARPRAMDALQACSAVGQGDLFRAYERRLADHDVRAAQILLTAADINARSHYINARQTINRLLGWKVVPIINENDTTATDEIRFGDNDFLAGQIAVLLQARLLVLLTNTDGVYNTHPQAEDARLIATIESRREAEAVEVGSGTSLFGTGGMGSKLAAAQMASESGVPVVICNGTAPGTLREAVAGDEVGTRFTAQPGKTPAFKLWLRYAKEATGSIEVDGGAAARLRESGASLLAVGITGVEGSFEPGAAVLVRDGERGEAFAKGISEFSAEDLRAIAGMKTDQVRDVLPHAADEVIHRDRLVLL